MKSLVFFASAVAAVKLQAKASLSMEASKPQTAFRQITTFLKKCITDIADNMEQDQKAYDKSQCYCDSNTAHYNEDLAQLEADIKELSARATPDGVVTDADGNVQGMDVKDSAEYAAYAGAQQELEANANERAQMQQNREQQRQAFIQSTSKLKEDIRACTMAEGKLADAGFGQDKQLKTTEGGTIVDGRPGAWDKSFGLPSPLHDTSAITDRVASPLTNRGYNQPISTNPAIRSFLQEMPELGQKEFFEQINELLRTKIADSFVRTSLLNVMQGKPAGGNAFVQTRDLTGHVLMSAIASVCTGLEEEYQAQVDAEEAQGIATREAIEAKEHLMNLKQTEVEAKAERYGTMATIRADAAVQLKQAKARLMSTRQMLTALHQECDDKRANFNAKRADMRNETVAIETALDILEEHADETNSFLQLEAKQTPYQYQWGQSPVYQYAGQWIGSPNPQLALLGTQIRAQEPAMRQGDGFDAIFTMIKKLIAEVEAEQTADDEHYDSCRKNMRSTAAQIDENDAETAKLEVNMAAAEDAIADIQDQIKGLGNAIASLEKALTEATEDRAAGKNRFDKEQSDMMHEHNVFERAISTLKGYYAHSQAAGQQNYAQTALDSAVKERGSRAISLLTSAADMIEQDMVKSKAQEENDIKAFQAYKKSNEEDQDATSRQKTQMELQRAEMKEEYESQDAEFQRRANLKKDLDEQKLSIDNSCQNLLENYAKRKRARQADREGMIGAAAILEDKLGGRELDGTNPENSHYGQPSTYTNGGGPVNNYQ